MKWILAILFFSTIWLPGCNWLQQPAPKPQAENVHTPYGITVEGASVGKITSGELETVLKSLAEQRYIPPVNARFDNNTGKIIASTVGRRLDVAATAERVMSAEANTAVEGVYQQLQPSITSDNLRRASHLGSFRTRIIDNSPGRLHNIKLTAQHINNIVIQPGAEFSFNRQTGEPTGERGFKEAKVFIDGRTEQGLGGGMCQVSSTLYNAALNAGLKITERHAHSQPVSYVPPGRDATTYTDKDLRFVNTTRKEIIIRAFVDGDDMAIDLLGLG